MLIERNKYQSLVPRYKWKCQKQMHWQVDWVASRRRWSTFAEGYKENIFKKPMVWEIEHCLDIWFNLQSQGEASIILWYQIWRSDIQVSDVLVLPGFKSIITNRYQLLDGYTDAIV